MKRLSKYFTMSVIALTCTLGICGQSTFAKNTASYVALDKEDPITFGGTYIIYDEKKITLSEKSIYVDGSLSEEVANQYPYVYRTINEALSNEALTDGTEEEPMKVYIAPYVYWIDDPLATDTVQKVEGYSVPYGVVVECEWLSLHGLTKDPDKIVIAGNRGQSHGANGNYTMFYFKGNGLSLENLTLGNYCSVDLNYELLPKLSQKKRTSAITQAQLGDLKGDKFVAENCNFISRLNLNPINGGTRSLYNKCHFESTDDALNGNAVYLECNFDFYGNRPLYASYNTGAVFLDCKFNSFVLNVESEPFQYFTKEGGPITAVDCEYTSNFPIDFGIGWTKYPLDSLRCYQYNIKHNGENIIIAGEQALETVDMTGKSVLDAYRISHNGDTYYNTYNLLKGNDDWDPMNVKKTIKKIEGATNRSYTQLPTMLSLSTTVSEIESGQTEAILSSELVCFDGTVIESKNLNWSISKEDSKYAKLLKNEDGTYTLKGINTEDEAKEVCVEASTNSGLESSITILVKPTIIEAPTFKLQPRMTHGGKGTLKLNYRLNLGSRADQSLISWYRCTDVSGANPILVAVSRMNDPKQEYTLTKGDVGYYIMAQIQPKHIRSHPGKVVSVVYNKRVKSSDIKVDELKIDFIDFPTVQQPQILPGFWTVDCFRPLDTNDFGSWKGDMNVEPWVYGETGNGSIGTGLYQGTQGARLMYTPTKGSYSDMTLKLLLDPAKTAGQGFGSAGQYMDICIKFDTSTLTGYGLRIVRTKAASNACSFILMKYENGRTTEISKPIIASCYATGCEVNLKVEGTKLTARVETPTLQLADQKEAGWAHDVNLTAEIETNTFGGIAIFHTGTPGTGGWQNTTMLHQLDVDWK